jgi:8-hydroxy-5-deazaflavin:NADPH oxidoreductase
MRIGILGSGRVGGPLGSVWAAAGHDVMFCGRDLVRAQELAERAEADAAGAVWTGTALEAAVFADVLLLAVPSSQIGPVLSPAVAHLLGGKLLIDATNPFAGWSIPHPAGWTHSECVAAMVPHATVVKAFNMMPAARLAGSAPSGWGTVQAVRRLAVFMAGGAPGPRRQVAQLVRDAGFAAVDVGPLRAGAAFEPGAPLFGVELDELEAQRHLARLGDATVPLTDEQVRAAA